MASFKEDRVGSAPIGDLFVKPHTQKCQNFVHNDTDKLAARDDGRNRNQRLSSSYPSTSEGSKKCERSRSPSRAEYTDNQQRSERSPADVEAQRPRWKQEFEHLQHIEDCAKGHETDSPGIVLPNDLLIFRQEGHDEEGSEGEPSSTLELCERLTKNVAAGAILLPSWREHLKMIVKYTERELSRQTSTNELGIRKRHPQGCCGQDPLDTLPSDPQEHEIATLMTPLERFHISPEPSSEISSDSSGLFAFDEDDDGALPLELAPDVTLKPAMWDAQEIPAEYMEEDEEEGEEQIPYTPPSYESVYGVSRPCPSRVYVGAYQAEDTLSRYRYVGKPRKVMTSRGKRYLPYSLRASPPEPCSLAGMPSPTEHALPGGRKDKWSSLTHRKGVSDITHKFGRLVLRT